VTTSLWITIVSIAALDSINPTATAVHLFLLGTAQPLARARAFVFGIFGANYLGGLFAVLGLDALLREFAGDWFGRIDAGARAVVGLALLIAARRLWGRAKEPHAVPRPKSLRPIHAFTLGVAITCVELPTALPYLAAIAILAEARLGPTEVAGVLLGYNLVLVLPLLILLSLYLILRQNRSLWFERIGRVVSRWFPRLMPVFLGLLGGILIADGVAGWFGRPLL